MLSNKYIYICLTFDTDSDPNPSFDQKYKNILGWKGMSGIYLIRKHINKLEKKYQIKLPLTWFVRCDDQIKYYKKKSTWLLEKYKNFWENELSIGSELQWHAHLYNKTGQNWKQKTKLNEIKKELRKNLSEVKKFYSPKCIRIGEAYMSNNLMRYIKKLNLKADSTSLPGRKRKDKEKNFDWSLSGNQPYFPSSTNYQKKQKKDFNFIELPMNTINTKTSYDKKSIKRYINLSFKPSILSKGLKSYIKVNKYLISITHPYELLNMFKNNKNSKLITFNISSLEKNIQQIISIAKQNKLNPKFVTINELINLKTTNAK